MDDSTYGFSHHHDGCQAQVKGGGGII